VVNGSYAASGDVDGDGRLDLLYDRDGASLRMFVAGGPSTWLEDPSGPSTRPDAKTAMVFADYDDDDDLDAFVGGRGSGDGARLWRNDAGVFSDVTAESGLDVELASYAADFGDYDNDGDLDLVFTSTDSNDRIRLARNDGTGYFAPGVIDVPVENAPSAVSFVDYDNDGDLDLSVVVENAENLLLRNETDGGGALAVRVRGRGAGFVDRLAIGTTVRLFAADGQTFLSRREVGIQKGPGSGPLRLHFGGLDPEATYVVETAFHTGTVTSTVVPGTVRSIVGSTEVEGLLTVVEP